MHHTTKDGVRSPFMEEAIRFFEHHPDLQYMDMLLPDLNGILRGKRIPIGSLEKLEKGCYFPVSVFALDINGNTVEESGLGQDLGEPDHRCVPIPGTLMPAASDPERVGQLLLTMQGDDEAPMPIEPRNILQRQWEALKARGIHPVVAVELEFYLIDRERDESGRIQPPCSPVTQRRDVGAQVYSVDNLNDFDDFLQEVHALAEQQGLPLDGAVAEAAPGQFEINLRHSADVLAACDEALALKRLIHGVAERHEMEATFMAKPYPDQAGSGMHIHISIVDEQGNNLFSDAEGDDSPLLLHAVAGMIDLLPASIALLAPNVNSYRRFQPGMYVPLHASWGHNNRTVALRIPCGDRQDRRIEHRVAGADANPYLVVAAILAALQHGLEHRLQPPPPVVGNGLIVEGDSFPFRMSDALAEFEQCDVLKHYLGEEFCHIYHVCKNDELLQFERHVTELELNWILKTT
ncbi:glutamine synthetase family protein [Aeromonas simiae]|uniref:glutamine synthetase family protein n=1 Tax=Aeromonas simiae TaxID=218936 RepID=UPI0005A8C1C9|nr:glutamine synthetase family protein [Aeromonas simiae]MDO2949642.1 glutamine synthetase family protein [Aeromonas simiae]MDO2953349.1 glutamine synthetase family protein [Aeromonas simiae]MDO2957000.1 glutamine synthetase family protein [Aeromonas simiae]